MSYTLMTHVLLKNSQSFNTVLLLFVASFDTISFISSPSSFDINIGPGRKQEYFGPRRGIGYERECDYCLVYDVLFSLLLGLIKFRKQIPHLLSL